MCSFVDVNPANTEQVCKPNSVSRRRRDGDHSSRPAVAGGLERPTRRSYSDKSEFGRAALLTPPYLVLHCEEFAWPRMSPHAPVRSYIKPANGPHHFTHHPDESGLVCSLLHLSSSNRHQIRAAVRPGVLSNAPPLAGSLPYSVRTFLSRLEVSNRDLKPSVVGSNRPTCSLQGRKIIANQCSTGIAQAQTLLNLDPDNR